MKERKKDRKKKRKKTYLTLTLNTENVYSTHANSSSTWRERTELVYVLAFAGFGACPLAEQNGTIIGVLTAFNPRLQGNYLCWVFIVDFPCIEFPGGKSTESDTASISVLRILRLHIQRLIKDISVRMCRKYWVDGQRELGRPIQLQTRKHL